MKSVVTIKVLFLILILCGCTKSVHLVHVSDSFMPNSQEMTKIQAVSEQFVILGFVTDTDYVNQAYEAIQAKCPQGQIQGLTTQFSTAHGFLSWTNKILIQGWCIP